MSREPLDLRLVPIALGAWGAAAVGVGWPPARAVLGGALLLAGAGVLLGLGRHRTKRPRRRRDAVLAGAVMSAAAALTVAGVRTEAVGTGPLPDLAQRGAFVEIQAVVTTDPVVHEGTFAPYAMVRLRVVEVAGRGGAAPATSLRSPVLLIGSLDWSGIALGDRVEASGRLQPARDSDLSAVLKASAPPVVVAPAGPVLQ